jgi:mannose-6-phosphate isomerase-like protein (cupin superfamily)
MTTLEAFVVPPGAGDQLPGPAGGLVTFKARAIETAGTFTALENTIAPGMGPGLHLHQREDEMYYVLEGFLRFRAGAREFDAPAGSFVFIPRTTPHCFRNDGGIEARLLVMFTPSGMERFFEGSAALNGHADPDRIAEVMHDAWMTPLGPGLPPRPA